MGSRNAVGGEMGSDKMTPGCTTCPGTKCDAPHAARTARRLKEAARAAALLVVIASLWCIFWGRTSRTAWETPIRYEGDAFLVMGWVQTAADGHYWPVLPKYAPRLGAPFTANWNDYPVTEDVLIFCTGLLAKAVGLIPACNLAVLIAQLLAGLSFYGVCRRLRYRWEWAFLGGILFAFAWYAAYRNLCHLPLTYYWHIPLCLLAIAWLGSRRGLAFSDRRWRLALAAGLVTGLQNPYYTNIFLQFLCFCALAQLIRRNAWQTVASPLCVGAVAAAGFLLMNADSLVYARLHGKNSEAVGRNYASLEVFALKPMELLTPPPSHRSKALRNIGKSYAKSTFTKGEIFSPYLGLVGIGALLWLAAATAKNFFRSQPVPALAMPIGWCVLYSVPGGLNCVLGMAGLVLFRGTNRYSIVILALLLLFLVRQLSKCSRNLGTGWRWILVVGIGAIGLWDQLPPRTTARQIAKTADTVHSDQVFAREMESALPKEAMIFQLPVMDFPEHPPIHKMGDYEHLRPYFFSRHLRYSYGNDKGRSIDAWQKKVESMSAAEMIATLEGYGFSAIFVNRKAYGDHADALIANLTNAGGAHLLQDASGDFVCIPMHPSPAPIFPAHN